MPEIRKKNFIESTRILKKCVLLTLCVLLLLVTPVAPVFAHETEEHMADDLVHKTMPEIESQTNAIKQQIKSRTGVEPGAATHRLAGDPALVGQWSAVIETPVVPVFTAVLPSGKVLIWDSVGDYATETYPDQTFTRAMVWNPTDDTYKQVNVVGSNVFCAGFTHLPNGNILVVGGNKDQDLNGLAETHVFDWQTETWSKGANLRAGRWYPSVAAMANGEQAIIGGGPAQSEVYQTDGSIRLMPGFTNSLYGGRKYPFMSSRPDTLLQLMGPYQTMFTVSTAGTGTVMGSNTRDSIGRTYAGFVQYDVGKFLVVGGGGGRAAPVAASSVIVNTNTGLVPNVTATGSLSSPRRQLNVTALPDGAVLATGGASSAATSNLVDLDSAVTTAEVWTPSTGTWQTLSSASRIRQYHSIATLLPDGRVMTGGGGICGDCTRYGYLEKNIEYFSPPYLNKKDEIGNPLSRPTITTAPETIAVNTPFAATSPQAASIAKVALVGLGDVTHSTDHGQRYVPLAFTASGTTLTVQGPANSGVTPPGYYMLFVIDTNGVPSVAKMIQIASGPTPLLSRVRSVSSGLCLDLKGSNLAAHTPIQAFGCNGSKAQALSRLPNDKSLRVLGKCFEVSKATIMSGAKLWSANCNGNTKQQWSFDSVSKTLRPATKLGLCVTSPSAANQQPTLRTCNGANAQKWEW